MICTLRNWSRTAREWNLASDPEFALHTPHGAVRALGGVTIGDTIKRNPGYYLMAHAARFIRPGSVRVHSSEVDPLPNVACSSPDSPLGVVIINGADGDRR